MHWRVLRLHWICVGAGGLVAVLGFGTCSGGFCGCIGSGTCAGGFWGCTGLGACAGRFYICTGRFGGDGGFGIWAGRFGNGVGSVICAGGPVSGGFCGLGEAWICAWCIGTITTSGSSGGFWFGRSFLGGVLCEGSFTFAWSVALVFVVLHVGGSFGAGWSFFCHMVPTDLVFVPAMLITAILNQSFL